MSNIFNVTDQTFTEQVLKASVPTLVDFWAEWCGPCKTLAPILENISYDMDGKLQIAKLNVDDNPTTPITYGIRGIPTLILFKDGNVVATKVGSLPQSQLYDWVESIL
jgi:thioredoxin 1